MAENGAGDQFQPLGTDAYDCWNYEKRFKQKHENHGFAEDLTLHVEGRLLKQRFKSLAQIPGFAYMKESLQEGLNVIDGNALQLMAAPHILAGRNCFLIGAPKSNAGKSLAYLLPIVGPLINETKVTGLRVKRGMGPRVLILCACFKTGTSLEETLYHLCGDSLVKAGFLHENARYSNQKGKNGKAPGFTIGESELDIVISTIEYAVEMIKEQRFGFSFDSLTHLVFDEAHVLLKFREKEVEAVLREFKAYAEEFNGRPCLYQSIFCGSEWNDYLEPWYKGVAAEPVLIINSAVQMLKYCGFHIQVVGTKLDNRAQTLLDILRSHEDANRILITVTDFEKLRELKRFCHDENVKAMFLEGEGSIGSLTEYAKQRWHKRDKARLIVVTTDVNIRELNITKACLIIHFDVPMTALRTFAIRYSPMWTKGVQRNNKEFSSYVIVPYEDPDIDVIVWKLKKLGATVSDVLSEKASQYQEFRMNSAELCMGFKCFGTCDQIDPLRCNKRHYFLAQDFDGSSGLPPTGQVELFITHTISPSVFIAKVLRFCRRHHVSNKVLETIDCAEMSLQRHKEIKELVKHPDYIKTPKTYAPGTKVVVPWREKYKNRHVYTRGEIVKVATRSFRGNPTTVVIKCVDIGVIVKVGVGDVYAMPVEVENLPPLSVEVVLANLAPPVGEKCFRSHLAYAVKDLLNANSTLQAEIALSIPSTIWVRRLVKVKRINKDKHVEIWDAGKAFVEKGIAIQNDGHLEKLYAECEKVGYSCSVYRVSQELLWSKDQNFRSQYYQKGGDYQWSFLEISDCEKKKCFPTAVSISHITQENLIFGVLTNFSKLLWDLENDLTAAVIADSEKRNWNEVYGFEEYYDLGMVVAVLCKDWYRRAIIVERFTCQKNVPYYQVFLVDSGKDIVVPMTSVYPILQKFVTRLNFQAIQLSVSGIKWTEEESLVNILINDLLLHNGIPAEMDVIAVHQYLGEIFGVRGYDAFMFVESKSISNEILLTGLAKSAPGTESLKTLVEKSYIAKMSPASKETDDEDEVEATNEIFDDECSSDDDDFDVSLSPEMMESVLAMMYGKSTAESIMKEKGLAALKEDGKAKKYEKKKPESEAIDLSGVEPSMQNEEPEQAKEEIILNQDDDNFGKLKNVELQWFQTEDYVFLRILLHDVRKHEVRVAEDKVTFTWKSVEPEGYGFSLILFKKVEGQVEVKLLGQYVELKLRKRLRGLQWKKLSSNTGKLWVKPELHFQDSDSVLDFQSVASGSCISFDEEKDYDEDILVTNEVPDDCIF